MPSQADNPSLVLFDIDGTLMITKGASSRCLTRAGEKIVGPHFTWPTITPGQLDPQIIAQLIADNGGEPSGELVEQFGHVYHQELEQELHARQEDITVLPGIAELVDRLHKRAEQQSDVAMGVLTGNSWRATELKLSLSGLGTDRFVTIVCAEDGNHRNDLPAVALQQANEKTGVRFNPEQTFIVGDTPRDVQCAQASGCRSISVATGHYTEDQLREAGGQSVFATLAETDAVMSVILG
jgi:phosphoglycolate phosphatase-like HAD superfamily hydrolase